MKCDENRPICVNCSTSDRPCSFRDSYSDTRTEVFPASSTSSSDAPTVSTCSSASSPSSFGAVLGAAVRGISVDAEGQADSLSASGYDLVHLGLLHHLETQVLNSGAARFLPDEVDGAALLDMLLKSAVSAPYLMDEVLAMSALHLSTLTSDVAEKQRYHRQAAQLQTRALTVLNTSRPAVASENCLPMFLFSGILGLHVLFEAASFQQDFTQVLDKFIQFLGLHRGIRTITRHSWHILTQTELRGIFDVLSGAERQEQPLAEPGTECDALMAQLTASSDSLGPVAFTACREAVEWLQWIIRQRRNLPRTVQAHVVMAWPVLISFDYLQMLRQRRPEALVILAHWAVFLHYERDFWVFGNSGRFMIESTSKYLGPYWDDWLAWPNSVLKAE